MRKFPRFWSTVVAWVALTLLIVASLSFAAHNAEAQPANYIPGWQNRDRTFKEVKLAVRYAECPTVSYEGVTCQPDLSYSTGVQIAVWNISADRVERAARSNSRVPMGNAYIGFRVEPVYASNPDFRMQIFYFNAAVNDGHGRSDWLSVPIERPPQASGDQTRWTCTSAHGPYNMQCEGNDQCGSTATYNQCIPCRMMRAYSQPHEIGDMAAVYFGSERYIAFSSLIYDRPRSAGAAQDAWVYAASPVQSWTLPWNGATIRNCDLRIGGTYEHSVNEVMRGEVGLLDWRDYPVDTFTNNLWVWMDRRPQPTIGYRCGDPHSTEVFPHVEASCN